MAFFKSLHAAQPAGVPEAQLHEAYQRGRIDERKRHHRSPLLTLAVCLVALVGAVTLYYAFRAGSFAGGGAQVDNRIAQVGSQAVPTVQSAAAKAGTLAQKAGNQLTSQGEAIKQDSSGNGR